MKVNNIYDYKPLQERQNTSPVLNNSGTANTNDKKLSKRNNLCRGEKTSNRTRPNVGKHTVFVLNINGKSLVPTTKAKARKLLKGGMVKIIWSKFGKFGIQLLKKTREEKPEKVAIGYDPGEKFEGFVIVCHKENNLAIKLDLPDKKQIVKKMELRRMLRQKRRSKLRRRKARFDNRKRKGFIASFHKNKSNKIFWIT